MKLYALCDKLSIDSRNISLDKFLTIAKKNGAEIIQYRDKSSNIEDIKKALIYLRANFDGFLIVNDKYELCSYCDGVHIGQEDLYAIDADPMKSIKVLKKVIGSDKIIGLSTHNKAEIEVSNTLDINYVGLGAYRATNTKDVSTILGDSLDEIASTSNYPVAAIGGVKLNESFKNATYLVVGSALYEN